LIRRVLHRPFLLLLLLRFPLLDWLIDWLIDFVDGVLILLSSFLSDFVKHHLVAEILEGFAWPTIPTGYRNSLVYASSFDCLVIHRAIDWTLRCCFWPAYSGFSLFGELVVQYFSTSDTVIVGDILQMTCFVGDMGCFQFVVLPWGPNFWIC